MFFAAFLALVSILLSVQGLDNGLGRTPPMGWNSWNYFACNLNESVIISTIEAIIELKLDTYGYQYVNLDDCWAGNRDKDGNIVADPKAFPNGIKAIADYAHSKGLKLGIYSDAGIKTCAERPGSLGYEEQDAKAYASWGIDFLKYDNCFTQDIGPRKRYPPMRDALNKTGRHIFFSMCEWGFDDPAFWAAEVGNSWRTTGDIKDNWESMITRADMTEPFAKYAGPGGWNDPDMLEVGNGGMNYNEYKAHFSLWCLLKAPLIIGCDLTTMSHETYSILTAKEVIAVNQDVLGIQGSKVVKTGDLEVWASPLANSSLAVILLNRSLQKATITVYWHNLGFSEYAFYLIRDLWAEEDIGVYSQTFAAEVEPHGVVMLKMFPLSKQAKKEGK